MNIVAVCTGLDTAKISGIPTKKVKDFSSLTFLVFMRSLSMKERQEYISQLTNDQRLKLLKWLENPNGSHSVGMRGHQPLPVFEAVEGGGILVRTKPYGWYDTELKAKKKVLIRTSPYGQFNFGS